MERRVYPLGPDRVHTVYRYTDQIYKVIQWYSDVPHFGPGPREHHEHHEEKLDSSLSRAKRVILEKALCNPWNWFCTLTIAKNNYDRDNLSGWMTAFTQWIRDLRKKGHTVSYLIVPEQHADGSWHAHGLLSGVPEDELISFKKMHDDGYRTDSGRALPKKLRDSDYMNWPAYQKKFGFCSLGRIKNPVATGFYVSKYITKEHSRMVKNVGLHTYYCSQGLQGAVKHIDFYGRDFFIDSLLINRYEFCATGMTKAAQNLDWTFCVDNPLLVPMVPLDFGPSADSDKSDAELEADSYFSYEQMVLKL